VFEELPPLEGKPRFYLAPAGDFELAVQGEETKETGTSFQLLAGLSGAESFAFQSKCKTTRGDILRFIAGQNAYVPVFPVLKPAQTQADQEKLQAKRTAKANKSFVKLLENHLLVSAVSAQYPDMKDRLNSKLKELGLSRKTENLLTGKYKTSWINIRPNPGVPPGTSAEKKENENENVPVFYSQPNDAALYDH